MLAFVLSSVLVASSVFIPAGAFPCNNCAHDVLASFNVTHNITIGDVIRVPSFSNRQAVAVNELSESKAVAEPKNLPAEAQGLARELPSGGIGRQEKCGKPPVQSQAPLDSSPAQASPQDVAGPQSQPSGDVPGSQVQPQGPLTPQLSTGSPRRKCKRPSSKSQSTVESQNKPLPPLEKKPQVKPIKPIRPVKPVKPCKPAPKQSKPPAENQEQQTVTQPSKSEDGVKPVEEQAEPPKVETQPTETPQRQDEPPTDDNEIDDSPYGQPSKEKAEGNEAVGKQQLAVPQQPTPQGPVDQGQPPAEVSGEPTTKPEKPAKEPETPPKEPEQPAKEPQTPAKEPETPAKEPEKPAEKPEKPAGKSGSPPGRPGGNIKATAHVQYSSSIGVLGCKGVDLSRIAFFPGTPSCDDICVKVTYQGRSVNLLRIDSSGSAPSPDNSGTFDMSCQAYDFLVHGTDNKDSCKTGDRTPMSYETVDPQECKHLLTDGVLPISAPNPNYYVECAKSPTFNQGSLKLKLFNINDARCQYGIDEECSWSGVGDPKCPSGLGAGNTRQLPGMKDPSYGG
ncbi:hypothetical protein CP532_2443 [Ophiocordyceps camponoti-leonardi (nom. inval.)]|nr:hypothetical protein CP532_2443 [Ophiocordyceps camponoti-leonardi (nom. inval.)]